MVKNLIEGGVQLADIERFKYLIESQKSLISDDGGHWACTCSGLQNVPDEFPGDIHTTFFVRKEIWENTPQEAIDAAIKRDEDDEGIMGPE